MKGQRGKSAAVQAARDILRRGDPIPPIDVEAIARAQGASVVFQELEDEVAGLLVIRADTPVIGINQRHHPNRQRFTLAHELGHLVLHRAASTFFLEGSQVFFRTGGAVMGTPAQEREANTFAAELLMPESAVREAFEDYPIDIFDDVAARRLADRFGVSSQALVIRLTDLRLIIA